MSMRDGVCPECDHRTIIETEVAEFGLLDREVIMCVTYDKRWILPWRNPDHGHGPLTLYTCQACGLSQWYAASPGKIPIGEEFRTRLIKG